MKHTNIVSNTGELIVIIISYNQAHSPFLQEWVATTKHTASIPFICQLKEASPILCLGQGIETQQELVVCKQIPYNV